MNINSELKKLVRGLLKNEQSIKEINEYLYEVILRWHHPDELAHRDTVFFVRDLKDFFEKLACKENDIDKLIESLNYLFSICEIEYFIDSLHNIMLCYLEYSNEIGHEPLNEYFNNYKILRSFLKELKLIEIEYNKKWELTNTN